MIKCSFLERHRDLGTLPEGTFDTEICSVQGTDVLDNGQSQARAARLFRTGLVYTVEPLTQVGKMFFSDADEVITINGGTFFCDGASNTSGYPWFVNTLGNNELQVNVYGGTFNTDINHQHRPFEVFVPETLAVKSNGNLHIAKWKERTKEIDKIGFILKRQTGTSN